MEVRVVPFKHYQDYAKNADSGHLNDGEIDAALAKQDAKWDRFIENDSFNGTFLQSRNFLNYHKKDKFQDCSLFVYKGTSDILAVIPAAEINEAAADGRMIRIFSSHPGSTFGGIIFNRQFYNLKHVIAAFESLENYWRENGFGRVILKQPSQVFSTLNNDLLEYFFFQRHYRHCSEVSFVIPLADYNADITSNFTGSRRRDYNYSAKNGFEFRRLFGDREVKEFHNLLSENLAKFGAKPVHTYEELLELKNSRLKDTVEFYGTYRGSKMMAGSMVFLFSLGGRRRHEPERTVFHTQYLAADQEHLALFPNNFNDTALIRTAKERGFDYFSFGISTEEHGAVLNERLAEFKEGFGTTCCNNKIWYKAIENISSGKAGGGVYVWGGGG